MALRASALYYVLTLAGGRSNKSNPLSVHDYDHTRLADKSRTRPCRANSGARVGCHLSPSVKHKYLRAGRLQ